VEKPSSVTIEDGRAMVTAARRNKRVVQVGAQGRSAKRAWYTCRAIRNGMVGQLIRIKLGDIVEQTHMRNRQMIAKWAMVLGKEENVVEKKVKDGKTYFVVNDYQKLRGIFGKMLKEIQRIKSEGDYDTAKKLVETYAVKIDYDLHKEILERYEKLKVAPYSGFIMPRLVAVEENGKVTDVKVEYPMDFAKQMLYFAEKYSFLPTVNN
jgi:dipeptidyl-peptidase-3